MILRLYFARPRAGQAAEYAEILKRTIVPSVRRQTGCLEVRVGRTFSPEGQVGFVVLSLWDSLDHLKEATGGLWPDPIVSAEEAPLLESTSCVHFEEL